MNIKNFIKKTILYTKSVYFNFHYLPFHQAKKLPFFIYKMDCICAKGKVVIEAEDITKGMIQLGQRIVSLYPNSGICWENKGGTVIFHGKCSIGGNSAISIGENSILEFGDDFISTAGLKIATYHGIKFGNHARVGWDSLIMDTNFHPLYDLNKKKFKSASGRISIGDYNWFGTGCRIMHSVSTPERCIFGMNSIVTRGSEMKSNCVMGGNPDRVLSENVIRKYDCDTEEKVKEYLRQSEVK